MKLFYNVLSGVGIILWTLCFFFGFNYTQNGALVVSVPIAVFVLIALGFFIWRLTIVATQKGKKSKIAEYGLIGMYAIVSLVTAYFIIHVVAVTTQYKVEIQDSAKKEMQELGRIFGSSETAGSYMSYVADKLGTYKIQLEGEGLSEGTISVKSAKLETELVTGSGYAALETEVIDFLGRCDYSVNNWVFLTVGSYLAQLEANKGAWEQQVVECSTKTEYTKNEPYDCKSQYSDLNLTEKLTETSLGNFSIASILLIIILQLMMMLTYIVSRPRIPKPIGIKDPGIRSYDSTTGVSGDDNNVNDKSNKENWVN